MARNWRRCAARLSGHKKRNTELTHCINRCFRCGRNERKRTHQTLSAKHPLGYLRTNVSVQQFEEFMDAFSVQPGDKMYLAPEERISVW
ncbi:MAG: hypothetical protein IJV51_04020 [Oscillospiraceae bacterium]|nr:hypothetical protein [Oscillospiraceae bacterium]